MKIIQTPACANTPLRCGDDSDVDDHLVVDDDDDDGGGDDDDADVDDDDDDDDDDERGKRIGRGAACANEQMRILEFCSFSSAYNPLLFLTMLVMGRMIMLIMLWIMGY